MKDCLTNVTFKNAFFSEMQFLSHRYAVVSYQALFRLSVYKIPAVYLSGAKKCAFLHDTRLWFPDYNLILITKSISMIFIPNFVCVLTNERYKTYQAGFSFCCPGHAPGMGFWGARGAQRVKKIKHIRLDFYSVAWIMLRSQKSKSLLLSVRYAVS